MTRITMIECKIMKKILPLIVLSLALVGCMSLQGTPKVSLSIKDLSMELKQQAYRNITAAVSADGKYVAVGNTHGDLILWDIQNGSTKWKVRAYEGASVVDPFVADFQGGLSGILSIRFTPDGKKLLTGATGNMSLKIWDIEQGKVIRTLEGHKAGTIAIAISKDGKKAVTKGSDGTVRLWDIQQAKLLNTLNKKTHFLSSRAVDITPDGKYSIAEGDEKGTIQLWDNTNGKSLLSIREHPNTFSYGANRITALVFIDEDRALSGNNTGGLKLWDIKTGQMIRLTRAEPIEGLSLSHDEKYILSSESAIHRNKLMPGPATVDQAFRIREVESGGLLKSFQGTPFIMVNVNWERMFDTAYFHPDGKHFISRSLDASIRIWDINTGQNEVLLVGFTDGEWIAITSEGYYNASPKGSEYLSASVGGKSYDINMFYDVFYRPDIVAAKLRGEDTKDLITITLQEAIKAPPPAVEFTSMPRETDQPKINVCYRAKSTGGGIGEVRLFHNGKLIKSDGYYREIARSSSDRTQLASLNSRAIYDDMRSVSVKGKVDSVSVSGKSKGDIFEDCKEVDAIPGDNEVSVTAFNSTNTVQSYMKTINFNSKAKAEDPHLYILAVGIDQYQDKAVNLKYAVKDAKDLEEKLKTQSTTLYKQENIHYSILTDQEATKTNITGKINQLTQKIKPQDSFILFVAGHGVLLQNQYYMLTHDYNGIVNDNSMISSNEIVEMSKKIKSLSQLFIFDTCHAGGVDTIVSGLYDARMSVLAKKMGLHIYASANDKQAAMDGYKGNGLFSYTLLAGLNNNKEADKNKDGKVSIVGLGEYSKKMTTNISKLIGHEQTPLIINFGKDSPIYKLQ